MLNGINSEPHVCTPTTKCLLNFIKCFFSHFQLQTTMIRLTLILLGTLMLTSLVNMMPIQSDIGDTNTAHMTTAPDSGNFTLSRYVDDEMVLPLVGAMQTIWFMQREYVRN